MYVCFFLFINKQSGTFCIKLNMKRINFNKPLLYILLLTREKIRNFISKIVGRKLFAVTVTFVRTYPEAFVVDRFLRLPYKFCFEEIREIKSIFVDNSVKSMT